MKKNIFLVICMSFFLKCFGITWTGPQNISGPNSESSYVAIDGSGNAIAIWMYFDGSNTRIQSSTYTGTWSSPVTLSSAGSNANYHDLALNSSGDKALVLWELFDGTNFVIQAVEYSSGTWGSPVTISTPGANAFRPKIAINSSGDGFAVWIEATVGLDVIMVAPFSGGTWGTRQLLSDASIESINPVVALSDSGIAIAAWMAYDVVSMTFEIQGSFYNSGIWSTGQTLSATGVTASFPHVVMNSTGIGFALWQRNNHPTMNDAAVVSHFNGTSWDSQTVISDSSFNIAFPNIAINDTGNAIAGWRNADLSPSAGAAIFSSGAWGTPQIISTLPVNSIVEVGIDGSDQAIAVWSADSSGDTIACYAENSSGTWNSPITISASLHQASFPKIAMDANGDAVAVWNDFDGSDHTIQGAIGVP